MDTVVVVVVRAVAVVAWRDLVDHSLMIAHTNDSILVNKICDITQTPV